MRSLTLFTSFIIIALVHYFVLTFIYEKKKVVIIKPPYQKVSVQLASLKVPEPIIEKPIEPVKKLPKPIIQEKVFKKPIKKEAIRPIVKKIKKKKPKKKPKKKVVKRKPKKIVKKKPIKKIVKKKPEVKPEKVVTKVVEKPVNTPVKKVASKASNKNATKSLEKFKKFKSDYKSKLRAAIDRNKKYPIASKRLKEQGLVKVSFRVLRNGVFKNIRLITPSGKKRLDKAALRSLNITARFKAFPRDINKPYIDFTLALKFQIR